MQAPSMSAPLRTKSWTQSTDPQPTARSRGVLSAWFLTFSKSGRFSRINCENVWRTNCFASDEGRQCSRLRKLRFKIEPRFSIWEKSAGEAIHRVIFAPEAFMMRHLSAM